MKSIICLIFSNYGFSFIYVILAYTSSALSSPPPCGLYGAPPCQFLPAPPGQTPTCARPGKTYCEHVDNYPTYLIKHLVHKWGYEAKNLLVDETWDDFAAVAWHETPVFYDPAFIFPQRHLKDFNGYNYESPPTGGAGAGIGAGAPLGGNGDPSGGGGGGGGVKYGGNSFLITKQQQQTTEPPTFLLYSSAGSRLNLNLNKNQANSYASSSNLNNNNNNNHNNYNNNNAKVTPNNPTLWLKRIVRDLATSVAAGFTAATANATTAATATAEASRTRRAAPESTRDVSLNMDLLDIVGVEQTRRVKRQSPGRNTLCATTSQFITPQAALNSKGNWMFVVNEQNTAKQMVKAELCASNTCSNLCQLPNGYNSRCEQKFVQKRLIALQGNGQNLYTDTFWFPSCCVCTISAAN